MKLSISNNEVLVEVYGSSQGTFIKDRLGLRYFPSFHGYLSRQYLVMRNGL